MHFLSFVQIQIKLIYFYGFSVQVWYWHPGYCQLGKYRFILCPYNLERQISLTVPNQISWDLAIWLIFCLVCRVQNAEVLCLGLVSAAVFMLVLPLFRASGGVLLQMAPPSIPTTALSKCLRQVSSFTQGKRALPHVAWELFGTLTPMVFHWSNLGCGLVGFGSCILLASVVCSLDLAFNFGTPIDGQHFIYEYTLFCLDYCSGRCTGSFPGSFLGIGAGSCSWFTLNTGNF